MRHENLFIATTSSSNANAAVIFEFLKKFIAIGVSYFGAFDEDAVKNNFVLVYELLDGRCNKEWSETTITCVTPTWYLLLAHRDSRLWISAKQ